MSVDVSVLLVMVLWIVYAWVVFLGRGGGYDDFVYGVWGNDQGNIICGGGGRCCWCVVM